jgi:flagellar biosynthesis protein FlhG
VDQASHLRKIMEKESRMPEKSAPSKNATRPDEGPRVFSITSGKGGVGKTNLVANLALAFRNMGKRVLIFDGDLGLANIDIVFGVHPKYTIGHVISGEKELTEIITEIREGISIIPGLSGDESMSELTKVRNSPFFPSLKAWKASSMWCLWIRPPEFRPMLFTLTWRRKSV